VPNKKEDNRMLHIRLTQETHKGLRIRAAEEDVSIQELVSRILDREAQKRK
jgi:predicted HicB family RNase H-like nuclease